VTSLMRMEVEWHGELPVASVHGEVDVSNVEELGARLRGLVTNRHMGLVADLTATSYLDSAGINLLFAIGAELAGRQQALRLVVGPASPIARVVAITSLDRAYHTYPSVPEAVAAAG
jgi:anti-sigma B factor antagonist